MQCQHSVCLLGSFFTIFLRLSITMFTVPHLALGAELSDDYIERSKVMSFNNIFNYGGWVIMHIFVWIIVFPITVAIKLVNLLESRIYHYFFHGHISDSLYPCFSNFYTRQNSLLKNPALT